MSLLQRKFFVIANKVLGAKLYKTRETVKKYEKLYPGNLSVEQFESESDALTRLSFLKKEHERTTALDRTLAQRQQKAEASLDMKVKEEAGQDKALEEPKEESENSEKKEKKEPEFTFFSHFRENEELFKNAQTKIDPAKIYHMFFDGASKFNPGPVRIKIDFEVFMYGGSRLDADMRFTMRNRRRCIIIR